MASDSMKTTMPQNNASAGFGRLGDISTRALDVFASALSDFGTNLIGFGFLPPHSNSL